MVELPRRSSDPVNLNEGRALPARWVAHTRIADGDVVAEPAGRSCTRIGNVAPHRKRSRRNGARVADEDYRSQAARRPADSFRRRSL